MGEAAVLSILKQIDSLPEADRLLLERYWRRARGRVGPRVTTADIARTRGIDQAAIDRAVEAVRYPPRPNGSGG